MLETENPMVKTPLRHARIAALLSLFFMGAGQIYNGQKIKGALLAVTNLL